MRASVTKQYNLVPVKGRWCPAAGKVTVGLASHWPCVSESSGLSSYGLTAQTGRWAARLCCLVEYGAPCACSVRLRVVALVQENAGSAQSRDHGPVAGRRRRHSPTGLDWTFHGRQVVRGVTLITIVIYLRCFSVIAVLLLESWHEEKPCVLRKVFCKLDVRRKSIVTLAV